MIYTCTQTQVEVDGMHVCMVGRLLRLRNSTMPGRGPIFALLFTAKKPN